MDRGYGVPPFPRGGLRGELIERLGDGGGWPDALSWAIFAVLLALLLLAILSLALDAYYRSRPAGALAALDMRYARGELPREAYLQSRADLGGPEATTVEMPAPPGSRRRSRRAEGES